MKLENYILDTNKKNCDMLLFYPFISFTCGNTGPLKKKPQYEENSVFFLLLIIATGLKHTSINE